jgi:hypothetical protein
MAPGGFCSSDREQQHGQWKELSRLLARPILVDLDGSDSQGKLRFHDGQKAHEGRDVMNRRAIIHLEARWFSVYNQSSLPTLTNTARHLTDWEEQLRPRSLSFYS